MTGIFKKYVGISILQNRIKGWSINCRCLHQILWRPQWL